MRALDVIGLAIFLVCWTGNGPLMRALGPGHGLIASDMAVVRAQWMRNMTARDNRLMDSQLLGHALNSATFFASSNLLLIAAAAGALFGGETTFRSVSSLVVIQTSSRWLFEVQLALVLITLSRGLLDFIWAIRQMNYCLAGIGAAPWDAGPTVSKAYAEAIAKLLSRALSAFNTGVRGYYFALAAAAWLFGPIPFIAASLGAFLLLVWRQRRSPAAAAIAELRRQIETLD